MKIRLLTVCKNEEKIMPFFIQYYEPWVDEIIIVDGNSTDESLNIAKKLGGNIIVVKNLDSGNDLNDVILLDIRNNAWKEGSEDFDWQIVCDMDEFLYHPNILNKLHQCIKYGVTIPTIHGYDMIGDKFPKYGKPIIQQITRGIRDAQWLDKAIIFNPKKVKEINYSIGCHQCSPVGEVVRSKEPLKLLHYKYLGYDYLIEKATTALARLSQVNLKNNWSFHYKEQLKLSREQYTEKMMKAQEVINPIQKVSIQNRESLRLQDEFVYNEMFIWNVYQMFPPDVSGRNILDIGGHFGMFTLRAHDLGARRIIAVEANPNNFVKFLKNTKEIVNLKAINAACSYKTGDILTIDDNGGGSRIGKGNISISTVSLEDLVSLFPDGEDIVLKMDIEGYEDTILKNTNPLLFRRFSTIFIEIHGPRFLDGPDIKTNVALLESFGFRNAWAGIYYEVQPDGSHKIIEDVKSYKFVRV